jgi:hypothetical protein
MSNRQRRGVLPLTPKKPPEGKKLSGESQLLWERFFGPMQGAAAQFNAAIRNTENILAAMILEKEGFSAETHLFDMDRQVILPRPPVKES